MLHSIGNRTVLAASANTERMKSHRIDRRAGESKRCRLTLLIGLPETLFSLFSRDCIQGETPRGRLYATALPHLYVGCWLSILSTPYIRTTRCQCRNDQNTEE